MIVYDLKSVPENMGMEEIVSIVENHGFLLWDSHSGGAEPIAYNSVDTLHIEHYENFIETKIFDRRLLLL